MRLHHLAFRTDDVVRLTAFYEDVLGFRVTAREADRAWIASGEVVLMLERRGEAEPAVPARSMELVAFAVSEPERHLWRERLAAAGISVEASTAYTLYFRDPDGRRIGVSSYRFDVG